jgi:hypothetical protein
MPHHESRTISGAITHIFGHRFVVRGEQGDVLADITPKGAGQIELRLNDRVTCESGSPDPRRRNHRHRT